jgi:hypothetical protein
VGKLTGHDSIMAYGQQTPPAPPAPMGADESEPSGSPEEQETATLPIDFCPGMTPKEGDTFKVKVVSVDEDSGTQTVVYSAGASKPMGGIKAASQQFDSATD